jgi:hypothetical protein
MLIGTIKNLLDLIKGNFLNGSKIQNKILFEPLRYMNCMYQCSNLN